MSPLSQYGKNKQDGSIIKLYIERLNYVATPKKVGIGWGGGDDLEQFSDQTIHLIRSLKINNLALSKEGFQLLCLESFLRIHKTEMTWKNIAATHFLPVTSSSLEIALKTVAIDRGALGKVPHELRSQHHKE